LIIYERETKAQHSDAIFGTAGAKPCASAIALRGIFGQLWRFALKTLNRIALE
jgi:hypothetical protein